MLALDGESWSELQSVCSENWEWHGTDANCSRRSNPDMFYGPIYIPTMTTAFSLNEWQLLSHHTKSVTVSALFIMIICTLPQLFVYSCIDFSTNNTGFWLPIYNPLPSLLYYHLYDEIDVVERSLLVLILFLTPQYPTGYVWLEVLNVALNIVPCAWSPTYTTIGTS